MHLRLLRGATKRWPGFLALSTAACTSCHTPQALRFVQVICKSQCASIRRKMRRRRRAGGAHLKSMNASSNCKIPEKTSARCETWEPFWHPCLPFGVVIFTRTKTRTVLCPRLLNATLSDASLCSTTRSMPSQIDRSLEIRPQFSWSQR